jgi:hypothetical protein
MRATLGRWNARPFAGVDAAVTEQQRYEVVETRGDVELRRYADCVVADVVVTGSAEQAGNRAFRPLVSYISGSNQSADSLAMTAPVIQQPSAERLAMTAPVIQEEAGAEEWTVSFVLPGSRALDEYPVPTDPRVSLRAVAGETAATLRWSGRWTSGNVARRTEELRRAMADAGWEAAGAPRWARFDPPWTPPFARRNEIVIPVHQI